MPARRQRVPKLLAALAASAAFAWASQGGMWASLLPTLYVNYTTSCTFAITDDAGKLVTAIPPGTYQVEVATPGDFGAVGLAGVGDMTACMGFVQFQLTGPGVSLQTTLDDGDSDYALLSGTFRKSSTYVAQDNNQPSVARVVFTTLAAGTPPTPIAASGSGSPTSTSTTATATGKPAPYRGKLVGAVSAAGTLTLLTAKGKAVSSLESGRYKVTVADRSRKAGFALHELHKAARNVTGVGYTGRRTIVVDLEPGQWFVYPNSFHQRSYFAVVS